MTLEKNDTANQDRPVTPLQAAMLAMFPQGQIPLPMDDFQRSIFEALGESKGQTASSADDVFETLKEELETIRLAVIANILENCS